MEELNDFRLAIQVDPTTRVLDLGATFVIEQHDDLACSDIHLTPAAAMALVAAIMSRLNA